MRCLRRLKSRTPLELGPGAVVSCAAILWLRAFASFSSFSERLALRERPGERGEGG